jgi:cobyric acid synthase CobQ
VLVPVPSYHDYQAAANQAGCDVVTPALSEEHNFILNWPELERNLQDGDWVILGQPNNPTGQALDTRLLRALIDAYPENTFLIDEAFAEFMEPNVSLLHELLPNLIVLRSLTKFYAIPGLRLGFAVADAAVAARMREQLPPWSVNSLAQAVGLSLFEDAQYGMRTRTLINEQRAFLEQNLVALPGVKIYPSDANFLLARLDHPHLDARALAETLLAEGIIVRICENFIGLDHRHFRVAIRTQAENTRLLAALSSRLQPTKPLAPKPQRARSLMIQGTSSNAGKSVLTAALGRILLQDGVRVAPFKSQNMSLNSFVTRAGDEMGRAQVVQAQACRLEPDVRMNPILLKPTSDTVCQVILKGKPVENMNVPEYFSYQRDAFKVAQECYDSLAAEFDVMLLEGAGSPGEVNLRQNDIVNMRMAEYADAPVVIVGDIDRGGVFASFVGTSEVLLPHERKRIGGWIVNRFRGDERLLGSALDYTLRHTGKPVLGVVPYIHDLMIPQEDGVDFQSAYHRTDLAAESVEIAVLELPHISNFTDLDALRMEDDVRLTLVRTVEDLQQPDAVIIPGSKNTLADLEYLRQQGLAQRLTELAAGGKTEIIGICAGFQMLGCEVRDPHTLESQRGQAKGLGLLNLKTILRTEKILTRTQARHALSSLMVSGYEIHHGRTAIPADQALFMRTDGQALGALSPNHRVWGTYLHGVFDADEFRRWFINHLRVQRGLPPRTGTPIQYSIEPALDRLADVVRKSLDMKKIYQLLRMA